MELVEALEVVLEMAKRSFIRDDQFDNAEEFLKEDKKQKHAVGMVEYFIANVITQ